MIDIDIKYNRNNFCLDIATKADARVIALFGRSGAGKSTFVNMIAGVNTPDSGHIILNNVSLFDSKKKINVPADKRKVGYVFQDSLLFPHMSVKENLLYGYKLNDASAIAIFPEQVIALLGLETLLDRKPANLSGGEKQRVAIGRALLSQPRVLLMDEPLASLDLQRKLEILTYIEQLRDELKIPIIYVSHTVTEVSRLADTVVLLANGKAIATGKAHEVINHMDFSLLDEQPVCSIIETEVVGHDNMDGLTRLAFSDGELVVPLLNAAIGKKMRTRIMARDVSLAIQPPTGISILNVLPAKINSVAKPQETHADVEVLIGTTSLQARVTRRSIRQLDIHEGDMVYALIKSISFDDYNFT